MRGKKLSDKMLGEAIDLGLCKQWTEEWGIADKHDMCEKFVNGLDFCIKHNWPSVEIIKKDFGDVMHDHGVYADETVHIQGDGTVVLNGCCDGSVSFSDMVVGNLYVRHSCNVRVYVRDFAYVHISVYDQATVTVYCEMSGRCYVYHYGGTVNTESKNVVIRDRLLK